MVPSPDRATTRSPSIAGGARISPGNCAFHSILPALLNASSSPRAVPTATTEALAATPLAMRWPASNRVAAAPELAAKAAICPAAPVTQTVFPETEGKNTVLSAAPMVLCHAIRGDTVGRICTSSAGFAAGTDAPNQLL